MEIEKRYYLGIKDEERMMRTGTTQETGIRRQTAYPVMTQESIDAYCDSLREQGRHNSTIQRYRYILNCLLDFLPEDKKLKKTVLQKWNQSHIENGLANRTIRFNMIVANGYLAFIQHWELQFPELIELPTESNATPLELTRDEYLRMLRIALILEDERAYMLVKVLALTGVNVTDMDKVTVEAVRDDGYFTVGARTKKYQIPVPLSLRMELMQYALRWGMHSGPLIVTKNGRAMDRIHIYNTLQKLAHDACVDSRKATPKCLSNLYKNTFNKIFADIQTQAEQSYEKLLEKERESLGIEEYYKSHQAERTARQGK